MLRLLCLALVAAPACLSTAGGPPAESTSGSTGGESTGEAGSSSGGEANSGGEASSSGEAGSSGGGESIGETSSTSGGASGTTADETTVGAQTSATSGPGSFCGDGVVDPGEECDDMNTEHEDACSLNCKRRRTVFITSEAFDPKFIGGLENADSYCRQFAQKMGSERWKTFVAWMSDSKTSVVERIHPGEGFYARPDGVIVGKNVEQFISGELLAPINVTETGETLAGVLVWTGTRDDGSAVPGAQHCDDWTSSSLSVTGHVGDPDATDSTWTYIKLPDVNPTPCAVKNHIYCIEGE